MNPEDAMEALQLCRLARYCHSHPLNLKCIQRNQVIILDVDRISLEDWRTRERIQQEGNLFLVAVDALAISLCWPDYVIYQNRLYQRGHQEVMPDDLSKSSYFGMRHYEQVEQFDLNAPYSLIDLDDRSESPKPTR